MDKAQICVAASRGGETGDTGEYDPKEDIDRCNRMVTDNIIGCPKEYKDGLDKKIVKDINMLMKLIKKKRKNKKSRKKQSNKKGWGKQAGAKLSQTQLKLKM